MHPGGVAALRILLAHHSSDGQTARISDRLARRLEAPDVVVEQADLATAPGPAGFDGVIVGDSIHVGRHSDELASYLRRWAGELHPVPFALFQVSLTSATTDLAHAAEALQLAEDLVEDAGVEPDLIGLFAGAYRPSTSGRLRRWVGRLASRLAGRSGVPPVDHEYTDWSEVERFAVDAVALVRSRAEEH